VKSKEQVIPTNLLATIEKGKYNIDPFNNKLAVNNFALAFKKFIGNVHRLRSCTTSVATCKVFHEMGICGEVK